MYKELKEDLEEMNQLLEYFSQRKINPNITVYEHLKKLERFLELYIGTFDACESSIKDSIKDISENLVETLIDNKIPYIKVCEGQAYLIEAEGIYALIRRTD